MSVKQLTVKLLRDIYCKTNHWHQDTEAQVCLDRYTRSSLPFCTVLLKSSFDAHCEEDLKVISY